MAGNSFVDILAPDDCSWWSPFLASGDITVVRVCLRPDASRERTALAWLDEAERFRSEKYLPEPRRRFVLCRAALRALLCNAIGCHNRQLSFEESFYGKPFALVMGTPAPLSFNVSHSGRLGLIAWASAGRLGVDVEETTPRRDLDSLTEAVMGPDEQAELAEMAGTARLRQFYRFWTCKEALIKALGTGFSTDISRFQVPSDIRGGGVTGKFRFPHLPSVTWWLQDIGGEGFAAALAYELPGPGGDSPQGDCTGLATVRHQGVKIDR